METVRADGVGDGAVGDRAAVVADTDHAAVATVANGKVPPASPTDMFSLDFRFRGNDGAVVVGGGGGVGDRAAVVGIVATVGDGIGDGAVATRDADLRPLRASFNAVGGVGNRTVVGDGHVRPVVDGAMRLDDAINASPATTPKSSFPRTRESRTNNSAQPSEFNAGVGDTVTVVSDATIVTNGKKVSSSYRQDAGIQTQGQQAGAKHGRRRRTLVTTPAVDNCRPWTTGFQRPAGMTSHSDGVATDNHRAAVVGTVVTVGGGVGDGAVAATVATVIDGTATDTGSVKKQNFHTGLDPVSRTNNSAPPTEFNATVTTADKVRFAQSSSLDTGSSPVWSAVVGVAATGNDHAVAGTVVTVGGGVADGAVATVTVANSDDATIATDGNHLKSSFPRKRESRTNNSAQPTEFNVIATPTHP